MPSIGRQRFRNPEQQFEAMLYGYVTMPDTVVGEKKIGDECARRLMEKKGDTTFDWEPFPTGGEARQVWPRWKNTIP